ncbi:hypothetical protein GCM10010276_13440 [Streptomyces longisporus]|uniref:Secreted peptide n=1 Tax=Streptomyces longisporus TaxID=1948 RepID=A0ABP5YBT0_STRLO
MNGAEVMAVSVPPMTIGLMVEPLVLVLVLPLVAPPVVFDDFVVFLPMAGSVARAPETRCSSSESDGEVMAGFT